jgi:hypothetical protein
MRKSLVLFSLTLAMIGWSPGAAAIEVTVFGPQQYERTPGTPDRFHESFAAMAGDAQLTLTNGDEAVKHRVSSCLILVNGQQVIRTKDVNQQVDELVVPIALADTNSIDVVLQSKPGTFVTLTITQDIPISLTAGPAGVGLEDPDRLLVALPIDNEGSGTAENVEIGSASLQSTDLLEPASFPVAVGDIVADGRAVFEAAFGSDGLIPLDEYLLTVGGTFSVGALTVPFVLERLITVPAFAPGSTPLSFVTVASSSVTGAPFPPFPEPSEIPEGFNEEPPPPVPTGALRGDLQPSAGGFGLEPGIPAPPAITASARPTAAAKSEGDPVLFFRSVGYGSGGGTWLDPTGATADDIVIATFNGPVSFSTDGGANFSSQSVTSIFPNNDANGNLIDGGLCCDQVMMYAPQIDRFVWLMQFRRGVLPGDDPDEPTGPNRYRLAAASPAQFLSSGGTAWTYWDLTSGLFGFGPNSWMDYPALSLGDNFLYLSADVLGEGGLFVARIPLADIAAGGVINIGFTDPALGSMAWGSHLVQNVSDTAYWAGHNTNSSIRLFQMSEGDGFYSWRDITVNTWPNSDFSSITPTGRDWLAFGFPGSGIIGGTRLTATHFEDGSAVMSDVLWLAWSAGRGGGFPEPHIQLRSIDTYDDHINDYHVWNEEVAFAYPALAVNREGEVGMALAFGGNEAHSNFAVGIFGDYVVYFPEVADASVSRFGDYFGIRRHWPNEGLFSAFGLWYSQDNPSTADDCDPSSECRTNRHHILFGRESALEPPPPPPS